MKFQRKMMLVLVSLCLTFSALSMTQELITEYNKGVDRDEFEKKMIANYGATFAVDSGIDYAIRNRRLIFFLCIFSFLLVLPRRTTYFALIPYGLTFPLTYQWITRTMRDLSYADVEWYMADSPYLLRIAYALDWALFVLLAITFSFILFSLIRELLARRPVKSIT